MAKVISVKMRFVLLFVLILPLVAHSSRSVLDQNDVKSILLSPDGEQFALLKRQEDGDALFIVNVAGQNVRARRTPLVPERIHSIAWLDSQRLALQFGEDVRYEQLPRRSGGIEVLTLDGASTYYGSVNGAKRKVSEPLAGVSLFVVDGMPSMPGVMLVASEMEKGLWLLDVRSATVVSLDYPSLDSAIFTISADAGFLTATGVDETGERRVLSLDRSDESIWAKMEPELEIVSISTSGIAYAHKANEAGVKGLVSIVLRSGVEDVVFQNDAYDSGRVLLDSLGEPVAVRYVPDKPNWFYWTANHILAKLHQSLVASSPKSDVAVISSSIDGSTVIAEIADDSEPSSYFFINSTSGENQRLLGSQANLMVVGGEEEAIYSLRSFRFQNADGSGVSGYVSLSSDDPNTERPTVVMLRDIAESARWEWRFNEEVWFFNRQGFNVLLVNEREGRVAADVEASIDWLDDNGLTDPERICFYGRGTGAETALVIALGNDQFNCVISMGGNFVSTDMLEARHSESRDIQVLFIFGEDEDAGNKENRERLVNGLRSQNVAVEVLGIADEKATFSSRTNEARAFAKSSVFLKRHIGDEKNWPTLPLTYQQSLAMNDLLEAFFIEAEENFHNARQWRRWFGENSKVLREFLTVEQLLLYEAYQAELIVLRRDPDYPNQNRPMGPARRSSSGPN